MISFVFFDRRSERVLISLLCLDSESFFIYSFYPLLLLIFHYDANKTWTETTLQTENSHQNSSAMTHKLIYVTRRDLNFQNVFLSLIWCTCIENTARTGMIFIKLSSSRIKAFFIGYHCLTTVSLYMYSTVM